MTQAPGGERKTDAAMLRPSEGSDKDKGPRLKDNLAIDQAAVRLRTEAKERSGDLSLTAFYT